MAVGLVRLRRADRTLHPKDEQGRLGDQSEAAWSMTPSTYSTDRLFSPDSVTEQTTVHLKSPEQ